MRKLPSTGQSSTPVSCTSIAVNGNGNIYLAGSTTSNDLPIPTGATPYQCPLIGTQNIFILELNPTLGLAGLLAMTYLGGSGTDTTAVWGWQLTARAMPTSAAQRLRRIFPPSNGYQSRLTALGARGRLTSSSALLNPTLSCRLTYSTYLSGNGTDIASGLAIDNNADAFVTGTTTSTDIAQSADVFPAS